MTDSDRQKVDAAIDRLLEEATTTTGPDFWGAMFDVGLAWVQFPEGSGGLGVSPSHQTHALRRLRDAGASLANYSQNILGIGMGGPVLSAHGTQAQMDRWLRPMFTTKEIWCQMFSEPGAGSDDAG